MADACLDVTETEVLRPHVPWFFFPKPVAQQLRLLSLSAQSVLVFIVSFTAGEHRRSAKCSNTLIQTNTGIGSANTVIEALRELVEAGLIAVTMDRTREGRPIHRIHLAGALAACYQAAKRAARPAEFAPQAARKSRGSKETRRIDLQEASSSSVVERFDDDVSRQSQDLESGEGASVVGLGEPPRTDKMQEPEDAQRAIPNPIEPELRGTRATAMPTAFPGLTSAKPMTLDLAVLIAQLVAQPFGIATARAEVLVSTFESSAIQAWVDYIVVHPDIKNPAGYLTSALERGLSVPQAVRRGVVTRPHRPELVHLINQVAEQVAKPAEPQPSPLEGLDSVALEEVLLEAKRRAARLLHRRVEVMEDDNPMVQGLMLEVAEEQARAA